MKKNYESCKIIYEQNEYKLTKDFERKNHYSNYLKIKLISSDDNIDSSYIFNGCQSLVSINDISKWNMNKISDFSFMFNKCSSLKSLPDIS